ncbi:MAG: arylsulfatase [Anaerohalosphaera sp.]|nr:arylsulfatase [Anaerohalosphaera sp.]
MDRRDFLKVSILGSVLGPAFAASKITAASQQTDKPNIVIIYADDIGYGDISCYGATSVKTPNVDRIAKQGIRFTSAYASSATCTPSRYSMLTGQYAWRKRGTGILRGNAAIIIDPGSATLPAVLKKAGYTTGVVGKWHLGLGDGKSEIDWNTDIKPGPLEIGFDYSFLMPATGDRVPCVYMENHKVINLDPDDPITVSYGKAIPGQPTGITHRDGLKMDWSHGHNNAVINGIGRIGHMKGGKSALWDDETMADEFVKHANKFIDRNKKKPFFLYFATHDIHVPRAPHPRFVGKTDMGPRGDAIAQFDWCVGQILDTLERLDLSQNTMIIVTSDNGPVLDDGYKDQAKERIGDHKPAGPFRGGKYSFYEGGTRMPFVLRWPKRVKPGTSKAIVGQVDFIASFAELTGQKLKSSDAPDSINVLPALLGESKTGRDHIIEHAGRLAIRVGNWKYIQPKFNNKKKTQGKPQLFHLNDDLGEKTDVADKYPEKVTELGKMLAELKQAGRSR